MAVRGIESRLSRSGLQPSFSKDNFGLFIVVSCGSVSGQFYIEKMNLTKRSLGKCALVGDVWYTPLEFEGLGGKKAKRWRHSLLHMGKPLADYNLAYPLSQPGQSTNCSPQDCLSQQLVSRLLPQHSRSQGDLSILDEGVSVSCNREVISSAPEPVLTTSPLSPHNATSTYCLRVSYIG